jgi:hypothetical protein
VLLVPRNAPEQVTHTPKATTTTRVAP